MKNLNFRQGLKIFFTVLLTIFSLNFVFLVYNYISSTDKVINLELSTRMEQAVTSLSFHSLNYADGEKTAIIDINSDLEEFEIYFKLLKEGGEADFRGDKTDITPFEDDKSKDLLSQLESEWVGYKENLQKITNSKPDRIDANAQKYIVTNIDKIKDVIKNLSDHYYTLIQESEQKHLKYLISIFIVIILFFLIDLYNIYNALLSPLDRLLSISKRIAQGELVKQDREFGNNEMETVFKGLNEIAVGLEKITLFAHQVGKGNFDASLEVRSDKDILAVALLSMRDSLKNLNEDEQRRKWTNEGLAKFTDILRLDNQELKTLGDNIISNLVKYTQANQGGIFIYNEIEDILELLASYAYERKRFIDRKVAATDGLLGQAFMEKDMIYLKDIPDGYVYVSSGLGEATPSFLLVIPLKIKENVFGVIELASFEEFQSYQIAFLEKLAENIASTLAMVKINEKTTKLLRESQEQSEMLRAQEEEMRQNVEELIATQEQMKQKQEEIEISNRKLASNAEVLRKAMQKSAHQSKDLEAQNAILEEQQELMTKQMAELEYFKTELIKTKEEEQKRTKGLIDQQKKMMAKVMEDFKNKEKSLKEEIERLKSS